MPAVVSEARLLANRANAQKSTGPTSEVGKCRSRANGLKHGLAGSGVVMLRDDLSEVESRTIALQAQYDPKSPAGQLLVGRMAVCSIQMDRGAEHETAAIAMKVRHAAEAFDDERFEQAERLIDAIGEDPRINLRKLRKSSEGVDRMIEEWANLRDAASQVTWTAWHLERAVNLTGRRVEAARGSLFSVLSKALWGDSDAGKCRAQVQLVEAIDAEIATLQAHRGTLDLEIIALDRAEAGSRALFDPSKEAALARRYESEAQRNFFKSLKELRQIEAEFAERATSESSGASDSPKTACDPLASSRGTHPTPPSGTASKAMWPATIDVSGSSKVVEENNRKLVSVDRNLPPGV